MYGKSERNNMDKRYFQYIMGDNRGQVVIFDRVETDGEDNYVVFKGGARCNESLIAELNANDLTGKYMAEVSDPNNVWQFKEKWVGREEEIWEQNADGESVCVQPAIEGRKVIDIIKPRQVAPRASNFGAISNAAEYAPQPPPPPPPAAPIIVQATTLDATGIDKSDPVFILMSKSKKVDTEIDMSLVISLPPKNLYNLAKESFEEGDEKFIKYIVSEITVAEIKEAIQEGIRQMYEETEPSAQEPTQ
jgi:hypothetical protein